jgi:hypothetical protein
LSVNVRRAHGWGGYFGGGGVMSRLFALVVMKKTYKFDRQFGGIGAILVMFQD